MKAAYPKVVKSFYDLVLCLTRRIEKISRHHRYTLGTPIGR
jgi:hypothetical protein